MDIQVRRSDPIPEQVESILRELPDWFGIEEALVHYVDQARSLPTYAAEVDGDTVGVCLVRHHSRWAAEIYLMAVRRRHHRRGIGRTLLSEVERDLASDGVEFLQVKTLGPSRASDEYEITRRFYEALRFRSLEELETDTLWSGNPCLLMVKHIGCVIRSEPEHNSA